MPEFIISGSVTLRGVEFYVTAKDKDEAVKKAADGDWHNMQTDTAETTNWTIEPNSVSPND